MSSSDFTIVVEQGVEVTIQNDQGDVEIVARGKEEESIRTIYLFRLVEWVILHPQEIVIFVLSLLTLI